MRSAETIFALSTAPGRAGIAVIRTSGSLSSRALEVLAGALLPEPRCARLVTLLGPANGEPLDRALVLWFPGPASFTGEDVAEFHVHGGRAVVAGVLEALGRIDGLRPAEPGEFARRAFAAGKMDLSEAEALADLIAAETSAQRRQALRGLGGGIGAKAEEWRGRLIEALALVEADIDFPDEGDVPSGLAERAKTIAGSISADIGAVLSQRGGERLRDGATIVIAGPPNAGKSSFLNRVARRDVAIVSPYAGTTRDMIEIALDLGGFPAVLIDTAGVRETEDPVEQEALRRARARTASADLVLWFTEDEGEIVRPDGFGDAPVWKIRNKTDLGASISPSADFSISALRGDGVDALIDALAVWLREEFSPLEGALITHSRHRAALQTAVTHLTWAGEAADVEIMAEELRLAARELGRISGRVDVEDVLDAVFGAFCIGK